MKRAADLDMRLLDEFQRDFPLEPRPFARIADILDTTEADVIARLRRLRETGRITRVGATCRPNSIGASTLAAMRVPPEQVDKVAAIIGGEDGVNHSYLREDQWNLWFVATAPDRDALTDSLARIEAASGLMVLPLPLLRAFNIDLGFPLNGPRRAMALDRDADMAVLRADDRPLMQALSEGLTLEPAPFACLARELQRSEAAVIARIAELAEARLLTRVGVIVRHRALGWRENAMVVWRVADADIGAAGMALSRVPGVTLCYQRQTVPGLWDWPLFCMIHARSRPEALAVLDRARCLPELSGCKPRVLFSTRCFCQRGAVVADKPKRKGKAA